MNKMMNLTNKEYFKIFGIPKTKDPDFLNLMDMFNEGLEEACTSDKWSELFKND